MDQKTGSSATLAIIAAIASYALTFTGHPIWGVIAGAVSIPLGVMGVIFAVSPRVGGGLISLLAIIIGAVAIVIGVLGVIGVILF